MHPLFLWRSCLWAATYFCYLSHKHVDLGNVPKRVALCLVLLALLPAHARPQGFLKVKAIAREAEKARKRLTERGAPQHILGPVFFKACPASNSPAQLNAESQEKDARYLSPHRYEAHGCARQVDGCPQYPAQAVRGTSLMQSNGLTQTAPGTLEREGDPLTPSPYDNHGTADLGSDMRSQLIGQNVCATPETQQGVEPVAPPLTRGLSNRGDRSMDICTTQQRRRRMREGNENGVLDNAGGACKVARRSDCQRVCPPICSRWC
jgi:hypothetical protein